MSSVGESHEPIFCSHHVGSPIVIDGGNRKIGTILLHSSIIPTHHKQWWITGMVCIL
jgi:hypothetical protein